MQKFIFIIIPISLQFVFCNLNGIEDVKTIEGMWEIYSVSSKNEVFYLKGKAPLVDYYVFNSDSTDGIGGLQRHRAPRIPFVLRIGWHLQYASA